MRHVPITCVIVIFYCLVGFSQKNNIPIDTTIVSSHSAIIKGQKFSYTATTGMQPLWDENGEPIATLHYTYYKRNDVSDIAQRPLMISFNGGPGSASAWMHLAYTGPKLLNIDDEGYPVQPYGFKDNPFSVLDVTDILYVNPVNTGYSRTVPPAGKEVKREKFFGVNADIEYLADWLNTFVSRNERWLSPKYLIGESYGGTRVSGLAYELQERQWMYLNGVILVSPADYKVFESDTPLSSSLNIPYFSATAWYYKMLPESLQKKTLLEILSEAEDFALNILMPALSRGSSLSEEEKEKVAEKIAHYTGLDKKVVLQNNLHVPNSFFWKELLRDERGMTIGRLDSRYLGLDKVETGTSPEYNAELNAWLHAFTPAINHYMRTFLGFKTDVKYNMFGQVHPWDRSNNNTRENLRRAMTSNPFLHVMFQAGYFDGATTYFNSKYTMWQVDPSGKMKDRMSFHGYESGHMMYLRKEDLESANEHIREFIKKSTAVGKSAKY